MKASTQSGSNKSDNDTSRSAGSERTAAIDQSTGGSRGDQTGTSDSSPSRSADSSSRTSGGSKGGSETSNRGFAAMDPEAQRKIASKGGRAAHESGNAHEFTSAEAAQAGRKGAQARSLASTRASQLHSEKHAAPPHSTASSDGRRAGADSERN